MAISKKNITDIVVGLGAAIEDNDESVLRAVMKILKERKQASPRNKPKASAGKAVESYAGKVVPKSPEGESSPSLFQGESDTRQSLSEYESRDALWNHLVKVYPTKASAIALSRRIRLQVTKDSSYDDMIERIIDATIGYKLRSRAIRGDS